MVGVRFDHVKKQYGKNDYTVKDFHLEIGETEFIVLLGESGCGKSTTLRMIAGLETISEGDLYIGNVKVNDLAPKDRDIAMVFQNYALYPHMTVYNNIAHGLKLRKFPKEVIEERVNKVATILGIDHLLERKPKALSGGQRQRVAIGRAIVREPKVFLMDEPLSNLDAKLRVKMRSEIIKLHKQIGTTFVYVTHDQTEAMTMGDRIVVMHNGVIQQAATPKEVYEHPVNKYVAGFIGSPAMNFIDGKVTRKQDSIFFICGNFECQLPEVLAELLINKGYLDNEITLGIRPEDIHGKAVSEVKLTAKVDFVENMGSEVFLHLMIGEQALKARLKRDENLDNIKEIELFLDVQKLHFFDPDTELAVK